MMRPFTGARLAVASHNAGKVAEFRDLLAGRVAEIVSAGDLGLPEPEETGATFLANAELKARAAATAADMPALADDSGLAVAALDGAPGIYSARWAGPDRDFAAAMARVGDALEAAGADDEAGRRAAFICVLSLCWPDGHCQSFEGHVAGVLVFPPRGDKGFGYDPIFRPDGYDHTFGEIDPHTKHSISHRAVAFRRLVAACFDP